jgi:hypothetical protein
MPGQLLISKVFTSLPPGASGSNIIAFNPAREA